MAAGLISFVLPHEPELVAFVAAAAGRPPWPTYSTGERIWVLQTYVELRDRGLEVELRTSLPANGVALFHAKDRLTIRRQAAAAPACLLVAVRADSSEALIADYEIVQNRHFEDRRRRFFVPHWPQPGLLPRDPGRGQEIRRVAFKGFAKNLHPSFREPAWASALERRGIAFSDDAPAFRGRDTSVAESAWNDYRTVDVVVAIRARASSQHREKPASKLVNAWLAGAPAILGEELPYREIRCCELCYLEAGDATEALAALDRLRADPSLYARMVEHGRHRASQFTVATIAERWHELLWRELPAAVARHDPRLSALRRLPPALRVAIRRLTRGLTLSPSR